eukprot:8530343-Pyramimonas_sp.AAC.1
MNKSPGDGSIESRCFWNFPDCDDGFKAYVEKAPPGTRETDAQWHKVHRSVAVILHLEYMSSMCLRSCAPALRSVSVCLLYTSDAADDTPCVDL